MKHNVYESGAAMFYSEVIRDMGGKVVEVWWKQGLPTTVLVYPLSSAPAYNRTPVGVINIDSENELTETFGSLDESDPTGRGAHDAGAKLDHGKVRVGLVLGGFSRALMEVCEVGTGGAAKYSDNGQG